MELSFILSNLILWLFFHLTWGEPLKRYQTPCPNECDLKKCPKLQFCDGEIVKDRCRCCPDCSTNIGFNSTYAQKDGACEQVSCPRFKVCMENMQGLPLCTCPNPFVCKGRRRHVCGKDGNTYESRCHLRVTSCHRAKRIRMAHKGACGMVGTQEHGTNVQYQETEFDISAKRRKNRKQLKRKNKKSKKRRRRKQKNRKNRRTKRRRKRGPKAKRTMEERKKNNLKNKIAMKNG